MSTVSEEACRARHEAEAVARDAVREKAIEISTEQIYSVERRLLFWLGVVATLFLLFLGGAWVVIHGNIGAALAETSRVEKRQADYESESRSKLDRLLESNARIEAQLSVKKP